jgi:nucleoid-associated protein YgaU
MLELAGRSARARIAIRIPAATGPAVRAHPASAQREISMVNEDGKKDDGMPDFSDVQSGASSTAPGATVYETYEVMSGDSLSKIAKRVYGNAKSWSKIYEANKDLIKDPDKIFPGQKLKLPK